MTGGFPSAGDGSTSASVDDFLGIAGVTDASIVGRGGSGVVYRARQPALNRVVAVKVLSTLLDQVGRERFEREGFVMGTVAGHPHIVQILTVGTTTIGRPYLLMPFVEGGSLAERLPLPWPDAVALVVKVCGALETAHQAGVLHRDLKPANVLISGYGEPLLADFGISRMAGGFETSEGMVSASIPYAAPEILSGRPASVAADLYSLGATLFCVLSGGPPFRPRRDEDLRSVCLRILNDPIPDLRPQGIPDPLFAVLEAVLAKDPADRPRTAVDFGRMLQDVQRSTNQPVTAMALPAHPWTSTDRSGPAHAAPTTMLPPTALPRTSVGDPRFDGPGYVGSAAVPGVAGAPDDQGAFGAPGTFGGSGGAGAFGALGGAGGFGGAGSSVGSDGFGYVREPASAPGPAVAAVPPVVGGPTAVVPPTWHLPHPTSQLPLPTPGRRRLGRRRALIATALVVVLVVAAVAVIFWPRGNAPTVAKTPPAHLTQQLDLQSPSAIVIADSGIMYVADRDKQRVQRISPDGKVETYVGTGESGDSGDGRAAKDATLTGPVAIALAKDGTLFVVSNGRVRKVDSAGIIRPVSGFDDNLDIVAIAVAADGTLYVAKSDGVLARDPSGTVRTLASSGSSRIEAVLARPDGNLLVSDSGLDEVVQISSSGKVDRVAGLGTDVNHPQGDGYPATATALSSPTGIAVDAAGRLYVAEGGVNRVRHVQPDGTLLTVAGDPENWSSGYTGDGGPAIKATFDLGSGPLAVDAAGNLFIGDVDNHRIRRVAMDGTVQSWG